MPSALPAAHLLAVLDLQRGERFVDVGDGVHATAAAALQAVGSEGSVVGVHPVLLAQQAVRRIFSEVDAVAAHFVPLPAVRERRAIASMAGLLRRGGRFAIATWGRTTSAPPDLDLSLQRLLPWSEALAAPSELHRVLRLAGLTRIELHRQEYSLTVTADEYLRAGESNADGETLRHGLGALERARSRHRSMAAFRARFGDALTYTREAHLAVGFR